MTSVVHESQTDVERLGQPKAVVVGVMAGPGVQVDLVLDAKAPVSVMTDALVKLVNSRLSELGESPIEADGRGRWALCGIDGTPLRSTPSLTDQDVYDGDRLWLRFVPDTERRARVIESVSTAAAADLGNRFAQINPTTAVRVGLSMLALGVAASAGLLAWWRWHRDSWAPAAYAAVIAVLVLGIAALLMKRAESKDDRRLADLLLLSCMVPLSVAAAATPPGPVGAPHAVLGLGVLSVAATLAVRFTGRMVGVYTAVVTVGAVAAMVALVRMIAMTGAVTLLTSVVMVCVLGYQGAPALSRRLAGIRLPIFPSANARWVFEARPELPTVVRSETGKPVLEGPASVSDVVLRVERARSFLTGLLAGLGLLMIVSLAALTDAHSDQRWPVIVLALVTAGFLLLRGRSYVDRWQTIILAGTAVLIVAAVVVRYALVSQSSLALSVGAAVLVLVPAAGLLAAAVVPNSIYSPLFRTIVEWIEYLCLLPIFPLALWLMNVYAAIRYR